MRRLHALAGMLAILSVTACNSKKFASYSSSSNSCIAAGETVTRFVPPPKRMSTEANVTAVTVGCGYVNEPCVSVTICIPGTETCQTIPNVLLDTGSYGLRLFSSVVDLCLDSVTNASGKALAECTTYADTSSQWGPIKIADVVIGDDKAPDVPIEIIDHTYGTIPGGCTNLDTSPVLAGFNGILGVGLLAQDCGSYCQSHSNNGLYYACSSSGDCTSTAVALADQVTNPVALMATDNNGVILELPSVPSGGAVSVSGTLTLGIDTASNNDSSSTSFLFPTNQYGDLKTTYNSTTYGPYDGVSVTTSSFIDSGSNGLFFPDATMTVCGSADYAEGFFCPNTQQTLQADQAGATGTDTNTVTFYIGNANDEAAPGNPNYVFDDLGAPVTGGFDWGLPFFLGRSIYVGLDGKSSDLGTGPYLAY